MGKTTGVGVTSKTLVRRFLSIQIADDARSVVKVVDGEELEFWYFGMNSDTQFYLALDGQSRWVAMSQSWEPIEGAKEVWDAFHESFEWDWDAIFDAIEDGEGNHLPVTEDLVERIKVFPHGKEPWYFGNRR